MRFCVPWDRIQGFGDREEGPKKPRNPPFITSLCSRKRPENSIFPRKKRYVLRQKLYEGIELGAERVGLITCGLIPSVFPSSSSVKPGLIFWKNTERNTTGEAARQREGQERPGRARSDPADFPEICPGERESLSFQRRIQALFPIYYRALASQMSDAVVEDQKIRIENRVMFSKPTAKEVVFDGFFESLRGI